MVSIPQMVQANSARWERAVVKEAWRPLFRSVAKSLVAYKARYQAVAHQTGVPWYVIAVIHERESSQNFGRSLAQGDPWNKVSVHVPAGRGPFASWEEAAVDALVNCAPKAAKWKDWSPGGTMTLLELYNGTGYATRGLPSPYVWSGTDQYIKGKYVADGIFRSDAVDKQSGCAGMLLCMAELDQDVAASLGKLPRDMPDAPKPDPKPAPVPAKPNKPSLLNVILSIIKAVFSWKR